MKNKFLITGKISVGKTTLMSRLIKKTGITPSGFFTLPYYNDNNERVGFYFHSLHEIECDNDIKISFGKPNVKLKEGFKQTFDTIGVECLDKAKKIENPFVFIDELGRFEQNSDEFIEKLNDLFKTNKFIFAIIKKEDIKYLNELKNLPNIELFDLDTDDFEYVLNYLEKQIINYKEGINDEKNIM